MKNRILAAAALAMLGGASLAAQERAAEPVWMAGQWVETRGEFWTEEFWTLPRGGIMIGAGRTGKDDRLIDWETTRIVRQADGTLSFIAQPGGKPPAAFPMVSQGEREIVFANPAHDYPQKIRYWRDDSGLKAEISLMDGSRATRFDFVAMYP